MFGKDFVEPFVCLQWTSSTVMAADAQSKSHLDLWWACPDVCAVGYCWFMYLIWSYMILYCIFRELQDDQRRDDSDDIFFFAFDWRHLQIRDAPLQSASVLEPGGGAFRLRGVWHHSSVGFLGSSFWPWWCWQILGATSSWSSTWRLAGCFSAALGYCGTNWVHEVPSLMQTTGQFIYPPECGNHTPMELVGQLFPSWDNLCAGCLPQTDRMFLLSTW